MSIIGIVILLTMFMIAFALVLVTLTDMFGAAPPRMETDTKVRDPDAFFDVWSKDE